MMNADAGYNLWDKKPILSGLMVVLFLCIGIGPSFSQNTRFDETYIWRKDKETGKDIAISRNEQAFNYFSVGNLSAYSFYLTDQLMRLLSDATQIKVDRSLKIYSNLVIHDENAFTRLKTDKNSFQVLGIPSSITDAIDRTVAEDTKCISSSFDAEAHDITVTVTLLSEKFNRCLVQGIFYSFGVRTEDSDLKALTSACILYEARRSGVREREELRKQAPALAKRCIERWGAQDGG